MYSLRHVRDKRDVLGAVRASQPCMPESRMICVYRYRGLHTEVIQR